MTLRPRCLGDAGDRSPLIRLSFGCSAHFSALGFRSGRTRGGVSCNLSTWSGTILDRKLFPAASISRVSPPPRIKPSSASFIPHLANLRLDTCISIRRTNQTHPRTHTNPQTNFHVNCSLPVISDHQQEIRIRKTAQPTLINSFSCPMKCLMTLTPQQQINHKKSASSRSSSGHFSRAAKPSNAHGALNPEGIFAIPTSPENQ